MVAEICSVGETVLVLVACVPANAAVESVITPKAKIKKYFFITILLVLNLKWTQDWGGIGRDSCPLSCCFLKALTNHKGPRNLGRARELSTALST
jgi:hypothetical protein